jgi:hypothetical protein
MNQRILQCVYMVPLFSLVLLPMGCKKPPPITLSCNASAPAIFPGDPLTVTATAGSIDPNKKTKVLYSWSGTGVSGSGSTATVATGPLDPGSYSAKAQVKEGKPGKEGLKPGQTAECQADYTVKAFEPPTISCLANPTEVQPGGTATVNATGVSPQNRPLTYSYSATAGTITGSGTTAAFSAVGAPTGAVGITCTVADDKNHTLSSNANVTVLAPPPPPPTPKTQALGSISFSGDAKRPTRVDNEAKARLDQIALELKQQPDAALVIVGDSDAKEKAAEAKEQKRAMHNKHVKVEDDAAQRAVNAKDYLVTDQGIAASRITTATGTADDQSVQSYLVPAGATFANDVQGTTPVDETAVKPQERKPLK